ncbi:MAG TPA: hypothetical protein VE572_02215 [Nitrososphaeraceae archaeon]|nr:hypothetical protein [Nitrososphaeraceae archaeon]
MKYEKPYPCPVMIHNISHSKNIVVLTNYTLLLGTVFAFIIFPNPIPAVLGQHHGAPPPAANIGDRKISLNFETQPSPVTTGQDVEVKVGFVDEKAKKHVNHVTFRMDISMNGKHFLSEFFHSHEGNVNLLFRNTGKADSSVPYSVGATSDVLTNAWIADPGSPIIVRGGEIFARPGMYRAIIEVTTVDNDKTDLPQPIIYEFNIPVSR